MRIRSVHFTHVSTDLADFVRDATEAIETMQQAMRVMSFGVDFRKYTKFRMLTPFVFRPARGEFRVQWSPFRADTNPNKEDFAYCVEFVINSALRLQQFDYSVEFAATKFFI